MKLNFVYGNDVLVLPGALAEHVDKATKKDIKILLALAAEPMARVDMSAAVATVCARLSISTAEADAAIAFWRGTGVIALDEEGERSEIAAPSAQSVQEPPRVIADGGLPVYSAEELSGILERRKELSALIDECQRVFGKIFNTREVGLIAGLTDFLGLEGEYILLLLTHCVRMEKKSVRYVEKMAITLHDEGVTDVHALEERLHRIETMAEVTGKIRAMFGASARALTTKEKGMMEKWICTMKYEEDVLKMAYDITVDAIGKASIPYANSVLERWYAEGYRTVQDVENALAEYRRKKEGDKSSFDVDDFFEAALKRSYGE